MAYGNMGGTSIGALLRMIQEQKATQPPIPPSADVGSPMRGIIQQPIQLPESPGTTHVASVKPEATPTPQTPMPMGGPMGTPTPTPAIPVPTPVPTPAPPVGSPAAPRSSGPTPQPLTSVAQKISAPSIATRISPTYGPAVPSGFQYQTPQPARMGQQSVGTPQTTPTPKSGPSGGAPVDSILRSIWDRLIKPFGGKAYA